MENNDLEQAQSRADAVEIISSTGENPVSTFSATEEGGESGEHDTCWSQHQTVPIPAH